MVYIIDYITHLSGSIRNKIDNIKSLMWTPHCEVPTEGPLIAMVADIRISFAANLEWLRLHTVRVLE